MSSIPTFAVVGAVNHGKSSVVSTLAENDQVVTSQMPGETVDCKRFALGDLFAFIDTPGFQNATEALEELEPAAQARDPLASFQEFINRHRGDPAYEAECYLFEPVVRGGGILYVVDGSKPVLDIHLSEMEVLRITGAPRLAIINRTSHDDHVADWKRRLGQHFNAVREFNAHHATFADRIELLDTLAGIEQAWKPKLSLAVQHFRDEWGTRLDRSATIVGELLAGCLQHRETALLPADTEAHRKQLSGELKERYMRAVAAMETKAHDGLIRCFLHKLVKTGGSAEHLFASDLFSDETWQLFGLDSRQLLGAGAAAGAAIGGSLDIITVGHTFLMGTAIGAAIGAGGALFLGRARPELNVDMPTDAKGVAGTLTGLLPKRFRLGGKALAVGPYAALNFPWILVDRAVATLAYVLNRAHARRDAVTIHAQELRAVLDRHNVTSAHWPAEERRQFERLFTAMRRGKYGDPQRVELHALLRKRLEVVSGERMRFE